MIHFLYLKLRKPAILLLMVVGLSFNLTAQEVEVTVDSLIEPGIDIETEESVEQPSSPFTPKEGTVFIPIKQREIPDSVKQNLKQNRDFWYVLNSSKKGKKETIQTSRTFTDTQAFQTLLWVIVILGFAAFVIMYLANSNVRLFRKANTTIDSELEELNTDDIFAINYNKEIDKATTAGNYRLAVRLMFLRLLKNLSEKSIIQYQHDRTNFDYLLQLSSTKYYNDFFRITRNYEYTWYGQFPLTEQAFKIIKKEFDNLDPGMKY